MSPTPSASRRTAWGRRHSTGDEALNAYRVESALRPTDLWTVFARAEREKNNELITLGPWQGSAYTVGKTSLGQSIEFTIQLREALHARASQNSTACAEFIALGAGSVQVCTAAMLHGFRIVEEMKDGLSRWMDEKGYATIADFSGKAIGNMTDWKYLDMNYQSIAEIDQDKCIGCGKCFIACEDTSHQSINQLILAGGGRKYEVNKEECVGCNLCEITCPVRDCITMVAQATGKPYMNWTQDPRNPRAEVAAKV